MDRTYIYVEKSSDNYLQRNLFSLHKHRSLVKFMIICTTTGYIVGAIGPYYANVKNNDAAMTKDLLRSRNEFSRFIKDHDLLIVDRGFRDCQSELKKKKY